MKSHPENNHWDELIIPDPKISHILPKIAKKVV